MGRVIGMLRGVFDDGVSMGPLPKTDNIIITYYLLRARGLWN